MKPSFSYSFNDLVLKNDKSLFSIILQTRSENLYMMDLKLGTYFTYEGVSSPDVIFVGKQDDHPGVGVFSEAADNLVELSLFGLPGDLHRLGDTHTP